jgi:hypothetical protein
LKKSIRLNNTSNLTPKNTGLNSLENLMLPQWSPREAKQVVLSMVLVLLIKDAANGYRYSKLDKIMDVKSKAKLYFGVLTSLMIFIGCNFKEYKNQDLDVRTSKEIAQSSTFAYLNENILIPKCVACHSAGNASGGVDLSEYSKVISTVVSPGDPEGSRLYQVCASGQMPKGMARLSDSELQIIYEWIKNGASENSEPGESEVSIPPPSASASPLPGTTPDTGVNPNPISSDTRSIQTQILGPKCLSCHSGSNPSAGLNLSRLEFLRPPIVVPGHPERSTLYRVCENGSMPKGGPPLNQEELKALGQWILSRPTPKPTPKPTGTPLPQTTPEVAIDPTFKSLMDHVLKIRCIECHSGVKPADEIDLTSYQKIIESAAFPPLVTPFEPEKSSIYVVAKEGTMPKGRARLSKNELGAIEQWIRNGATEDGSVLTEPTPEQTPDPEASPSSSPQ